MASRSFQKYTIDINKKAVDIEPNIKEVFMHGHAKLMRLKTAAEN